MDLDNSSLGELFVTGQSILTELEETSLSTADAEYQAKVQDGLRRLERAHHLVNKLAIFSSNELIDDINPHDLRFLLIPAYLGDLTLKRTGPIEQRKSVLETGKDYFQQYLMTCQEHQLLQPQDVKAFQESSSEDHAPQIPAAQQRQQKIDQFKREKATLAKIKELRERLDSTEDGTDTDDIERDWVMALIELHVMRSLQHLHAIQQEMVMIKEMEAMKDRRMESTTTSSSAQVENSSSTRSNWGHDKPLLNKQGRPLQPFVITSKREQLKNQVFRPGWRLPTMTIEEYLKREKERGNIIRGGGKEPEPKPEIDDNDHEALDAETMRQREWDEFKEANPRGWGNRGNKG